ncbi:MAG: hypothetical protein L6Q97_04095 [Thermoanaerobaculia bacterium]|nr:hypothetical protein [Thermoanaerobaculia bacterium]
MKYRTTRFWLRLMAVSAHACPRQATAVALAQQHWVRLYTCFPGQLFPFSNFSGTRHHFRGAAGYPAIVFRPVWPGHR